MSSPRVPLWLALLFAAAGAPIHSDSPIETSPSRDREIVSNHREGSTGDEEVESIRRLLLRQQEDWNRGDLEEFMKGYERSEELLFTSAGKTHRGWEAALRRYRETYPDREAMGQLEFSNLEITVIGESAALVFGRWSLRRTKDRPHGVFTLVLRKGSDGWKIIHDHTSASP